MGAPSPITTASAPEILGSLKQSNPNEIERLPNGCALIRYTQSSVEAGHVLSITYWLVAQVVPPTHARIATFSYTLLNSQQGDPRFQQELELLNREIRDSVFSPELRITAH